MSIFDVLELPRVQGCLALNMFVEEMKTNLLSVCVEHNHLIVSNPHTQSSKAPSLAVFVRAAPGTCFLKTSCRINTAEKASQLVLNHLALALGQTDLV